MSQQNTMFLEAPPFLKPEAAGLYLNRWLTPFTGFSSSSHHQKAVSLSLTTICGRKVAFCRPGYIQSVLESKPGAMTTKDDKDTYEPSVRIVALVGQGSLSPLKCTPWEEVMLHTVSK